MGGGGAGFAVLAVCVVLRVKFYISFIIFSRQLCLMRLVLYLYFTRAKKKLFFEDW